MPKRKGSSKLKGLLVTPGKCPSIETLEKGSLDQLYKMLGCSFVEMDIRSFNGKRMAIISDEEAKLKRPVPGPAIVTVDDKDDVIEVFVGKCFIVNVDDEGESASLDWDDICLLLRLVHSITDMADESRHDVLICKA